jgi:hypothetical protein
MNTMVFNCRGAGDHAIVGELRDLAGEWSPSILCILETQIVKKRAEGLAGMLGFDFSFGVTSSGRSGGLCLYWKKDVNLEIKKFSKYHIDSVISEPGKEQWRLTYFYGEANRSLEI